MIQAFWDAIMRINARLVLLWVCLVCCLVGAAWVWALESPERTPLSRPSAYQPPALPPEEPDPSPLPATWESLTVPALPKADPFASPSLTRELERLRAQREAEAESKPPPDPPDPPPEPEPEPKPPPAAPPIKVLYRGMLTRTDGSVLALVENKTDKTVVFVPEGALVAGRTVGDITRSSLTLLPHGDESPVVITNGIVRTVRLPSP